MKDDTTKTIAEHEYDSNQMLIQVDDVDQKMTKDEFFEMATLDKVIGVNHDDRKEWLARNGYEATRANMMNAALEPNLEAQVKYDSKQKS